MEDYQVIIVQGFQQFKLEQLKLWDNTLTSRLIVVEIQQNLLYSIYSPTTSFTLFVSEAPAVSAVMVFAWVLVVPLVVVSLADMAYQCLKFKINNTLL